MVYRVPPRSPRILTATGNTGGAGSSRKGFGNHSSVVTVPQQVQLDLVVTPHPKGKSAPIEHLSMTPQTGQVPEGEVPVQFKLLKLVEPAMLVEANRPPFATSTAVAPAPSNE